MRILFTFLFVIVCFFVDAQTNPFCKLKKGDTWETETSSASGKFVSRSRYVVIKYDTTVEGFVATVRLLTFDKKGKQLTKDDLSIICRNDTLSYDMRDYYMLRDDFSYKWRIEPSRGMQFPSLLEVGQTLSDAKIIFTAVKTPRMAVQVGRIVPNEGVGRTATYTISNRKVESTETVTLATGTFPCYKISGDAVYLNEVGERIIGKYKIVEWITPNDGVVKSEYYTDGGRLKSVTVLTKKKN